MSSHIQLAVIQSRIEHQRRTADAARRTVPERKRTPRVRHTLRALEVVRLVRAPR